MNRELLNFAAHDFFFDFSRLTTDDFTIHDLTVHDSRIYLPLMEMTELTEQVLLIDKPQHWTSFDVVAKLRNLLKIKKIGHAGTLDPLATGLLILCTGKFTKKINDYMGMEKEYTGTITLGASTPTYDLESEPENQQDFRHITKEAVENAFQQFTGDILQTPPIHSAIKIKGERVYKLAREGVEVKLEPRPVTIYSFELTRFELPEIDFKAVCSTGTYIRSLANNVGETLGCGGYLSLLRRTRIGTFLVEDAVPFEIAEERAKSFFYDRNRV